jgi:nitrate/nitrite-specific signal transduction histidine kinase
VSTSRSNHLAHAGTPHAQALTGGYHLAFLIAAGLVAAAIVVAALVVQSEKRAAAARARAGELAYEGC